MINLPLLSVNDLHVHFYQRHGIARVVEGISFNVKKGETVCLVGESGCGKTVSALSILGLVPDPPGEIVKGEILFNGKSILSCKERELQKIRGNQIAMVFQEPLTSLNPVFTIGDQIREPIRTHQTLSKDKQRQKCLQLMKDVGLPDPEERLNAYPHQLSGGQRQRVMIAMALACEPELIIADEPTTALDVTVQAQILHLFNSFQKNGDRSILYITHDLGVVANVADRIYIMYAGNIVEEGSTWQVFQNPRHPYTMGLLAALPQRGKRGTRLISIPGSVPNPAFKASGCPFHPRCNLAVQICQEQFPEMCNYGEGQMSRCPVLFERGLN